MNHRKISMQVPLNYYLTLALAQAGDPATALASPYTNITSPQTVYGRIEKTFTGCFDITELELIVILSQPLPTYELCDDDVADGNETDSYHVKPTTDSGYAQPRANRNTL